MPAARLPADEPQRLALLRALDLLDAEPVPAFEALTRLVARLLGVPMALVTLVDEQCQRFAARVGVEPAETDRAVSFCAHAILDEQPCVVDDATLDPRFADNPLVAGDMHLRAYLGVPLRSSQGHALGTLCAMDVAVRRFSAADVLLMQDLATLARREILQREAALEARRVAELNLRLARERESLYHGTFDRAGIGFALVDLDGRWQLFNPKLCEILGWPDAQLRTMDYRAVVLADDLPALQAQLARLRAGQLDHCVMECRYQRSDGAVAWASLTLTLMRQQGEPRHFVLVLEDITVRKQDLAALQALREDLERRVDERTRALARREAEWRAVLEHAQDAFVRADAAGVVQEWNRAAERTFGWSREEAVGRHLEELIVPPDFHGVHRPGAGGLFGSGRSAMLDRRLELPARCRDGRVIPCELRITALSLDDDGPVYAAFLHDISERKAAETRLTALALTDSLTGLPNRRGLDGHLRQALARARRERRWMGLLFLDLDHFKVVNDTRGHAAGDQVLSEVARRLRDSVRESDVVARLAGDEFVVLLEGLAPGEARAAELLAVKIIAEVCAPIDALGEAVQVGTSVGIALSDGRESAEYLLQRADQALYQAKAQGRGVHSLAPAP